MEFIDKIWKRILIAALAGGVFSELSVVISGVRNPKNPIFGLVFILALIILAGLRYWIPRYQMHQQMKKELEKEEQDLLDN